MATNINKDKLFNKKIVDYTFIIVFFLVFSFFIFFAIKPNLETAFKLQKELSELKVVDQNYNKAIDAILQIQSEIQMDRENLHLLNEAVPSGPQISKLMEDIQKSTSSSGITLTKLEIAETNLKKTKVDKSIKNFKVSFQSKSDFAATQAFLSSFLSQRRLKLIDKLSIVKAGESSSSAQLGVTFEIESFYL